MARLCDRVVCGMESQYRLLVRRILEEGDKRETRNGRVLSVFGASLECDLRDGFPLLTSKKVFFRGIVEELAWFLRGSTDVSELRARRVHIWDLNTEGRGFDAGPIYGFQWRHFGAAYAGKDADYAGMGVDQIASVIASLRSTPHSRRMVLCAWCPSQQSSMCLPPCHVMYQFYVESDRRVSVQMTQRSSDVFLGLPFNIASTALLLQLIAHEVDLEPGRVIIRLGDAHVYEEHVEACLEQLRSPCADLPRVTVDRAKDCLWDVRASEVTLHGYAPGPSIRARMRA